MVRRDLPLGVMAAQLAHAAGWSGGPASVGAHAVILAAKDEANLRDVLDVLSASGMDPTAITEPDPPWCGSLMAVALHPQIRGPNLRKALRGLPLLKEDQ